MKGLLIKDLSILKTQKTFFIFIFIFAVTFLFTSTDGSFILGYMSFLGGICALSTISYDESDNGNPFLFSLPISRKMYVAEKYALSLLLSVAFWFLGSLLAFLSAVISAKPYPAEMLYASLVILSLVLCMIAFMLPLYLKFGGEKAKIALFVIFAVVFLAVYAAQKIAPILGFNYAAVLDQLQKLQMNVIILILFAISIVLFLVSYGISVRIMEKKEY